jgi:excisionase family DNA binding protein
VSPLARALLAELLEDTEAMAELAAHLASFMPQPATQQEDDRWLGTREAALYLGLSVNALHRLTAARAIPFEQDAPGSKCFFLRSELDAWRRGADCRKRV